VHLCHLLKNSSIKKIWNQSDPSEALITTQLQENCRLGLIESVLKAEKLTKANCIKGLTNLFVPMDQKGVQSNCYYVQIGDFIWLELVLQ
jgi:hypothetical protein